MTGFDKKSEAPVSGGKEEPLPCKQRIGIMGGTFDPIHIGHLILGECAYEEFGLDKVLFMPSGNPPHKKDASGRASNEHRQKMTSLAIASNPHFELSLIEMEREGYIYTNETLRILKKEHPDTEYYFIMGADSLFQFHEWRSPQIIADLAVLAVAVRDNVSDEAFDHRIAQMEEMYHARILKMSVPNIDVSSTGIREAIAGGKSCRYFLPDRVMDYIQDNGLYMPAERTD